MIVAIGIDIIEVARIREVLLRRRAFASACSRPPSVRIATAAAPWQRNIMPRASPQKKRRLKNCKLAGAVGLAGRTVEIASRDSGAPYLILHGPVLELFNSSGATAAHLSLSHTNEHAIAEVILERTN